MDLTKNQSRAIAMDINNKQLQGMFEKAKNYISNWKATSIINSKITKGTAWNVLAKDFNIEAQYDYLTRVNMIREFGAYLPKDLIPKKEVKEKYKKTDVVHQEPEFKKRRV